MVVVAWPLHDHTAGVLLRSTLSDAEARGLNSDADLLRRLVEHLALSRQSSRAINQVIDLLSTLEYRLNGLVLIVEARCTDCE